MAKKNHLFDGLAPILFVKDLESEKQFYLDLGFEISYEGDEFPGFIAFSSGTHVNFGIEQKKDVKISEVNKGLYWQFVTTDIEELTKLCMEKGIKILRKEHIAPNKNWQYTEMTVKSPNGYEVNFESHNLAKKK